MVSGFSQRNKAEVNGVSILSNLIAELFPLYNMAHGMLRVKGAWCVACDQHTIVPWPFEPAC